MAFTLAKLQQKMMHEIAPGNPERFRVLLNEADELLLQSGKWHWVRRPLVLIPVDGVVVLPEGYESIMGARLGSRGEGVAWEEIEYIEEGPGLIPVQHDSCGGRLIDQGLLSRPSGCVDAECEGLELKVMLRPSSEVAGSPSWSSDGAVAPPPVNRWVRQYASGSHWRMDVFESSALVAHFISEETVVSTPTGVVTWEDHVTYGALTTTFPLSLQRCYKLSGRGIEEVSVLARLESREMVKPDDAPICQNYRALFRAMMSIHYEKVGDTKKAMEYEGAAVQILVKAEEAYRGAANQVFKPSLFGGRSLRHKPTNRR